MVQTILASPAGQVRWWPFFERLDRMRRRQGAWLESLGYGPEETPQRIPLEGPGYRLKAYAPPGDGPVMLLVPAPIKRSYIWDLAPGASVVQACLEEGLLPYLVHWEEPAPGAGLADYGDRFLDHCLAAIRAEGSRGPAVLAGHSLGGLLAAIYASRHPGEVAGLVLLSSLLHFSLEPEAGALGPVMAAAARDGLESLPDLVPGSVLSQTGILASPAAFGRDRWRDWLMSLPDRDATRTHLRVLRWTMDELPLAGRLVGQVARDLYQGDAFMAGTLDCGDGVAAAAAVRAPILAVLGRDCPVVPPGAMLPFLERAASREKEVLWYEREVGVAIQHLGMLVGRSAHARLWPWILAWVKTVSR